MLSLYALEERSLMVDFLKKEGENHTLKHHENKRNFAPPDGLNRAFWVHFFCFLLLATAQTTPVDESSPEIGGEVVILLAESQLNSLQLPDLPNKQQIIDRVVVAL